MAQHPSVIARARSARAAAYAPYSGFAVGAAVLTADDRIFSGANVENASYGLSMCAERSAVFAAIAAGATRIVALAVAGPAHVRTAPCGACRQVVAEFGTPEMSVSFTTAGGVEQTTLGALLPEAFDRSALTGAS